MAACMRVLCIDWETRDPHLKVYGSGAVFKYHYPEVDFELLGCGLYDGFIEDYIDFKQPSAKEQLLLKLQQYDIWLFHNASYDLACLKYLYRDDLVIPTVHDTLLIAKLVDQQLSEKIGPGSPYSLNALTKYYECEDVKESDIVHDYVWSSGVYQSKMKEVTGRNRSVRPSPAVLNAWCMQRLDEFPVEIVSEYCLQDVKATWSLYNKLMLLLGDYDLTTMSDLIKVCLKAKFRGIRLDLKAASELSDKWGCIADESQQLFKQQLNISEEFNINSNQQLGPILTKKGIKVPLTAKGNYSITTEWLEEQGHPMLAQLRRHRKAKKAEKDYIQKIIKYQVVIPEKYREPGVGRMFPTLKPLGATATGRFTSGGGTGSLELNVLAISSHDAEFGAPVRKLFLPEEGEKIVCCDFSNQEPRLMVHYANLLGCDSVKPVIEKWKANPKMKYHQTVSDMTKLDYDVAKMVTLGLAYDMRAFGLSTKLGISYQAAEKIIQQYFQLLPFMKQLQAICSHSLAKNGYIKTIGGRRLYIDLPYEWKGELRTQERLAMSKLIQGSGADQVIKSMIEADRRGLKVLMSIHDEIIISSAQPEKDLKELQDCMEHAYEISVPVIAEGGIGDNWGLSKPK